MKQEKETKQNKQFLNGYNYRTDAWEVLLVSMDYDSGTDDHRRRSHTHIHTHWYILLELATERRGPMIASFNCHRKGTQSKTNASNNCPISEFRSCTPTSTKLSRYEWSHSMTTTRSRSRRYDSMLLHRDSSPAAVAIETKNRFDPGRPIHERSGHCNCSG